MVACKQHIGGLRSSLVAYGQVKFWSTVKFVKCRDGYEAEVVVLG